MEHIRIKAAGALFDALIIDGFVSSCGEINLGIGAHHKDDHVPGHPGGFVLDWDDFERAYLTVKAQRDAYFASYVAPPPGMPGSMFDEAMAAEPSSVEEKK